MSKIMKQSEEDKAWKQIDYFTLKVESGNILIPREMFIDTIKEMLFKTKEKHGSITNEEHREIAMKYARGEIDSMEDEIKRIKDNKLNES